MKLWGILLLVLVGFFFGYFAHSAASLGYLTFTSEDAPGNIPLVDSPNNLADALTLSRSSERISPYDWISQNSIHVFNNQVILDINNPEWASFTDTNSMDPVIDDTAHAIEIVPKTSDDIHLGDIVSYKADSGDVIIHRVIGKGEDDQGPFFIFKGDNNPARDPGKIRWEQIQRVVVAIIY